MVGQDQSRRTQDLAGICNVQNIVQLIAWVFLHIVAADREDLIAALIDRHDVRKLDARGLPVFAHVLEPIEIELDMHLQDDPRVVAVRGPRDALDLVHLFTDLIFVFRPAPRSALRRGRTPKLGACAPRCRTSSERA